MPTDRPADIRFDDWTLRRHPRELLKAGGRVPLQDQPLQVLEELLTHAGEVVTREQLIARLWPKRVVDYDTALNAAVRRLRLALGDHSDAPRYIETIPRIGYRFTGTVADADVAESAYTARPAPAPDRAPMQRRVQSFAAAGLVALASAAVLLWFWNQANQVPPVPHYPSIAVLPFTDLSAEQDQQYFCDGLAEEILNLLSQASPLRVTARTSSFSFRGQNIDIPTVAKKLNVTHVLEGSVRKSGGRVRITTQLIDGATSLHLWSRTYDGELNDVLNVQSKIAAQVARALRVALVNDRASGTSVNPQAYEHFLQAHFFFQRRGPGDLERAAQHYRKSLDHDPAFARAWSGLSGVYSVQVSEGTLARDDGLEKSRDAAERALALDPDSPEAEARLTSYFYTTGDLSRARDHWKRAVALGPDHPLVLGYRVDDAIEGGRWDEAIEMQRRAAALDPLSVIVRSNLSYQLLLAGHYDEAATESLNAAALDPSQLPETLVDVRILQHQFHEALRLVEAWPAGAVHSKRLALIYDGLGHEAEADEALEALIASCHGGNCALDVAEVYAYRGEHDEAFKWLDVFAKSGRERRPALAHLSPYLESLHADARWDRWRASLK